MSFNTEQTKEVVIDRGLLLIFIDSFHFLNDS